MHRARVARPTGVLAGVLVAALLSAMVIAPADRAAAAVTTGWSGCPASGDSPIADRSEVATVHLAAVDCLWELGIIAGRTGSDGQRLFLPTEPVTRGQFAAMLHGILDVSGHLEARAVPLPSAGDVVRFEDVPPDHTFHLEVEQLAAIDVIAGVEPDRYEPARNLRRDQAASLVVNSGTWVAGTQLVPVAGPYFADIETSVHRTAIEVAFEHGLVTGLRRPCGGGEGRFSGGRSLQRQQAASMLLGTLTALEAMERGEPGTRRGDQTCPPPVWHGDLTSAIAYLEDRPGDVGIAVIGTDGSMVGSNSQTRVDAASVIKVMFLVAYLRQPDVRDRALTQADRDLLEPMIRWSANDPATIIADRLGPGPMNRLAEQAQMQDFAYTRPWGRTQTSARDQAAFMLEVDRYVPERHRAYVLDLLTQVVPAQRWGIGDVDTGAWTAHFKSGWGAGTGAVDHQVVLLQHEDGTRAAVAVTITDSPSHDAGKQTLQGVFQRLLADLP